MKEIDKLHPLADALTGLSDRGADSLVIVTLPSGTTFGYLPIDSFFCVILQKGASPTFCHRPSYMLEIPVRNPIEAMELSQYVDMEDVEHLLLGVLNRMLINLSAEEVDFVQTPYEYDDSIDSFAVIMTLLKKWDPETYRSNGRRIVTIDRSVPRQD